MERPAARGVDDSTVQMSEIVLPEDAATSDTIVNPKPP